MLIVSTQDEIEIQAKKTSQISKNLANYQCFEYKIQKLINVIPTVKGVKSGPFPLSNNSVRP
jgi:hypothetical protein